MPRPTYTSLLLAMQVPIPFPVLFKNLAHNTNTISFLSTVALKDNHIAFNGTITNHYVTSLAKQNLLQQALEALYLTNQQGITTDKHTYACLLQCCIGTRAFREGRLLHAHMIQTGFSIAVYLETKLVILYAKSRSLEDARQVFDKMSRRNVVTWTTMIAGYAREGRSEEVFALFDRMREDGIEPDQHTFASVLTACCSREALERGRDLHEEIVRRGFECDVFVGSALVDMYVKCSSLEDACAVFDRMPVVDAVTWSVLIAGYVQKGLYEQALGFYEQMELTDVKPNAFTLTSVLAACARMGVGSLDYGKKVHEDVMRGGFQSDIFVGNSLVDMYAKCGCIEDARHVFDRMPKRNVISWTAMISGYVQCGQLWEAVKLFEQTPDATVVSWTAMIVGYLQHGLMGEALKLFDKMPERDSITWSAIVVGFAQNGYFDESLSFFRDLHRSGVKPNAETIAGVLPTCTHTAALHKGMELHGLIIRYGFQYDLYVGNAILDMYAKCGRIEDSCKVFVELPLQDVVSWNVLIAGHAQCGHFDKALNFFHEMQSKSVEPNSNTFASVLPVCASLASLPWGVEVHEQIIRSGFESDVYVGSALVDMYAKCGRIGEAYKVFQKMPSWDVALWNAMIAGYAIHGHAAEALELFESMERHGEKPDQLTFLGALSACCHAGLVDHARRYFVCMTRDYQITPGSKHYGCMVDLLGRAGHLDEAKDLIDKMPTRPDVAIWGSLLSACKIHTNVELGEYAAEHLFELDPANASHYVTLSNIYAAASRWDGVGKMRKMMKERRVVKMPGTSWIEINKQVHAFVTGRK